MRFCVWHVWRSSKECSAPGLDGLYLGSGQRLAVETRREIVAVEKDPLRRSDGAQLGAGCAADAPIGLDGLAKRTELLGMVTVCAE
jgi:hypothetical protein